MEPCETCGATEGIRYFGTDYTPLCPRHYVEAERNVAAAEAASARTVQASRERDTKMPPAVHRSEAG